ncbi:hypothetical protein [Prosthecobacter sp.]|jgi:hypothetical protein|uniref:hypothetical protein n=1 Tax=Prosthecobacter sp. TaxID=1965333 RepID=UPI0037C5514E
MSYEIEHHNHRLAAWAASTSASASPVCRFKVEHGVSILESCGFTPVNFADKESLPAPAALDDTHSNWRASILRAAHEKQLNFTHGIAAKLINCYLKVRFVCAGFHLDKKVQALHPPIDALLLDSLARNNYAGRGPAWRDFHQKRWSKFDSDTYAAVIDLIRETLPQGEPLWKIEEHWEGHQ